MQLQRAAQLCSGVPRPRVRPPPYLEVPPSLHLWLMTATKSCWRPCHLCRLVACLHALLPLEELHSHPLPILTGHVTGLGWARTIHSTLHHTKVGRMLLTFRKGSKQRVLVCRATLGRYCIVDTAVPLCSLLAPLNSFAASCVRWGLEAAQSSQAQCHALSLGWHVPKYSAGCSCKTASSNCSSCWQLVLLLANAWLSGRFRSRG